MKTCTIEEGRKEGNDDDDVIRQSINVYRNLSKA
jgi:hypothetical protein